MLIWELFSILHDYMKVHVQPISIKFEKSSLVTKLHMNYCYDNYEMQTQLYRYIVYDCA